MRLQWEVKPFGTPFDGCELESGASHDTGAPLTGVGSMVLIDELVSGLTNATAYHWRVRLVSHDPLFPPTRWRSAAGNGPAELDLRTGSIASAVSEQEIVPNEFQLAGYPNPVRTRATVRFTLPAAANVRLAIYDVQGRLVRALVNEYLEAGVHTLNWDGRTTEGSRTADGIYWIRLGADGLTSSRRLMVTTNNR